MATRLSELEIDEVSGVEHPANELPGFLVTKAAGDISPEQLLKEVDRMESDVAILYSSLQACDQYFADAPEDVKSAADTLTAWVENLFKDDPAQDAAPTSTETPEAAPIGLSADKTSPGVLERLGLRRSKTTKTNDEENAVPAETEVPSKEGEVDEAETAPAEETPAEEPNKETVEKPEDEQPAALSADDLTKALTEALAPIVEQLKDVSETTETLKTVSEHLVDRVSRVEVSKQGLDPEEVASVTAKSATTLPRGEAELRAGFSRLARGEKLTLG